MELLVDLSKSSFARNLVPSATSPLLAAVLCFTFVTHGCSLATNGGANRGLAIDHIVEWSTLMVRLQLYTIRTDERHLIDFVAKLLRKLFEVAGVCHGSV